MTKRHPQNTRRFSMDSTGKRYASSFAPAGAIVAATAISLIGIAGCASTGERPDAELATARATIEQAQQAGANEHAAEPLSSAREKLSAAEAAVARDEMLVAQRLAEEAALDAELAGAMARNRKAERAVDELNDTIEVLRDEIARNQSSMGEMR
jgi:chromosome segregation ATPase